VTTAIKTNRPLAHACGAGGEPHIIRVAGAPQITIARPPIRANNTPCISLQHKKLTGRNRLTRALEKAGAKIAPSPLLSRLSALPKIPVSYFLGLLAMTQTLFPAAR
jgi:hypothetical protein